jgi:hypothetical protein
MIEQSTDNTILNKFLLLLRLGHVAVIYDKGCQT